MKKKVTYVISNINKALAFEWIAKALDTSVFELNFVLLNEGPSDLETFLKENGTPVKTITYRGKKDILKALWLLSKFFFKNKPDIVHAHLFDASLIGLMAAKISGVKKRIHTRHHSDLHHVYFPKAVKYDRFINWLSTHIVAISQAVYDILIKKELADKSKVVVIYHGFLLSDFQNVSSADVDAINEKYMIKGHYPVIGVIARYTEWKGIQFVIPAFKKLLSDYPKALLILANADGDFKKEIRDLLKEFSAESYREIPFESNIPALYKNFTIYTHVPISSEAEAFGQTYIESLSSGIPSVFTLSGIANEFIIHKKNAIVVDYKSSDEIYNGWNELLNSHAFSQKLVNNGLEDVKNKFELKVMISSLEKLYGK